MLGIVTVCSTLPVPGSSVYSVPFPVPIHHRTAVLRRTSSCGTIKGGSSCATVGCALYCAVNPVNTKTHTVLNYRHARLPPSHPPARVDVHANSTYIELVAIWRQGNGNPTCILRVLQPPAIVAIRHYSASGGEAISHDRIHGGVCMIFAGGVGVLFVAVTVALVSLWPLAWSAAIRARS